jgi:hypothetical protein
VKQLIAVFVFIVFTTLGVISGFASKSLLDQTAANANSAQHALVNAYSTVAVDQPGLAELLIVAAVGFLATRWRWKSSDRS